MRTRCRDGVRRVSMPVTKLRRIPCRTKCITQDHWAWPLRWEPRWVRRWERPPGTWVSGSPLESQRTSRSRWREGHGARSSEWRVASSDSLPITDCSNARLASCDSRLTVLVCLMPRVCFFTVRFMIKMVTLEFPFAFEMLNTDLIKGGRKRCIFSLCPSKFCEIGTLNWKLILVTKLYKRKNLRKLSFRERSHQLIEDAKVI